MPVLSLDEPLECRRFVFPDVPTTDVERAFGDVGGVARAVFDMNQLEALKWEIMSAARKVNLDLLRDAVEPDQKLFFDKLGIGKRSPLSYRSGRYKRFWRIHTYAVTVCSKYAVELIHQAVFERGRNMFENFVQGVNGDPELRKALGASTWRDVFATFAHRLISGE